MRMSHEARRDRRRCDRNCNVKQGAQQSIELDSAKRKNDVRPTPCLCSAGEAVSWSSARKLRSLRRASPAAGTCQWVGDDVDGYLEASRVTLDPVDLALRNP